MKTIYIGLYETTENELLKLFHNKHFKQIAAIYCVLVRGYMIRIKTEDPLPLKNKGKTTYKELAQIFDIAK